MKHQLKMEQNVAPRRYYGLKKEKAWSLKSGRPGFEDQNGNPLQYSCLENPMDIKAWQAQSMGSQKVGHEWTTNTSTYNRGKLSPLRFAFRICQVEAVMAKAVIQSLTPLRQKLYYHHKSQTLKRQSVGCGRNSKYHSYRTCQVSSISAFKTSEMGNGMMGP